MNKYIQNITVLLVIMLGVAIFYGNTLQNGFIHDDHGLIETNTYIQSFKYLPKVITGCVWESANGTCRDSVDYHPIQSLSYMFTYQISSKPWVFHLINLIYFVISIFLVFILVRLLTKNFLVACLSGFIFLIHPVNAEAVNWVAAGLSILITIFTLLATIFYILYHKKRNPRYLLLTYIFYALGIFSKESVVLIPLIFLTLDLLYFKQKISSFLQWKNLKPYLIFLIIFLIYMGLRFLVLGSFVANSAYSQTYNLTIIQYIYIFFDLFANYIKEAFWPLPLNYFHTFNPSYNFLSLRFLTDVLIVAGFGGACFLAWKKKFSAILFALIWFFVFLLPSLIFINSLGDNKFAERHIFTSMIGFSTVAAIILDWFFKKWHNRKTIFYGFLILVALLSFFYIYNHNQVWHDDISLDLNTLKNSPDADLIRYNLALEYLNQKDTALAKEQLLQIIKDNRWYNLFRVNYTLGGIYRVEGNYNEAISNYQASIAKNPTYKDTYNNLGALFLEKGDFLGSVTNLCKAMIIDPNFQNAGTNFNAAASAIQKLDNKSFISLYDQLLNGSIFKPASPVISTSLKALRAVGLNTPPVILNGVKDLPQSSTSVADSSLPVRQAGLITQNDKVGNIIQFKSKDCSYPQGCILIFSSNLPKQEFFFPFLIVGESESNEIVRSRYFEFNQQTSEIAVGIDHQFENSNIHFWFPTCDKTYYETDMFTGN